MAFITVGEVNDDGLSKKGKMLLTALAYAMDYNAQSDIKKDEYRKIIAGIQSHQKGISDKAFDEVTASSIASSLTSVMETHLQKANAEVLNIDKNVETNQRRVNHIHQSLVKEGFFNWRDRTFRVASYANKAEFIKRSDNKDAPWVRDNEAIANAFLEDFKKCLPPNVPEEAFTFQKFRDSEPGRDVNALIVSFNQAYEGTVREAIIKLTELNVQRINNSTDCEGNLQVVIVNPEKVKYDEALSLARQMPYVIETEPTSDSPGALTIEVLRSGNPLERLKAIRLQEQFPLLNISRYAETDKRLYTFLNDSFGGMIGKTEYGYRKAMQICAGHYAAEQAKEIDLDRALSNIDREMSSKNKYETIEPGM